MSLTYREVAEILRVIDASDCEELELELEGVRLVVRRHGSARVEELSGMTPPSDSRPAGARMRGEDADGVEGESGQAEVDVSRPERPDGQLEIRAPMVGTFYRAPSPGEPPFVEVGDHVERGTTLCVIEVMKLFTTIESTVAGRVTEILVDDAALIEYGQVLFVIDPAGEEKAGEAREAV